MQDNFTSLTELDIEWMESNAIKKLYKKKKLALESEKQNLVTLKKMMADKNLKALDNFEKFKLHYAKALPFLVEATKEDEETKALIIQLGTIEQNFMLELNKVFQILQVLNQSKLANDQIEYPVQLCSDLITQESNTQSKTSVEDIKSINLDIW